MVCIERAVKEILGLDPGRTNFGNGLFIFFRSGCSGTVSGSELCRSRTNCAVNPLISN